MENKDKVVLEEIQIDTVQKQKVLKKLAEAVEEKRYMHCPSFWEIFHGQLKYISGFCLGGQIAVPLILLILFQYFQKQGEEMMLYLGVGSGVSGCMGIFLIMELSRSRDFRMAELEHTCYLNLKQVWCVKMILFGCLDILTLTAISFGIAGNTSFGMIRTIVYLLVPFVVSNVLQLLVFTVLRSRKGEYLQVGVAILAGILSLLPLYYSEWYKASYFGMWVSVLVVSLVFLIKEVMQVYHNLEEGEGICWN